MGGRSQYRISCVKMVCGGVQSVRRVLGVDCGGGEEGARRGWGGGEEGVGRGWGVDCKGVRRACGEQLTGWGD